MKPLEYWLNRIHCGDALTLLREMPDECVDCVITSPPYWGLRDYGESCVQVWGGDPNCEHEWNGMGFIRKHGDFVPECKQATVRGFVTKVKVGDFCVKCGAWRGQLGLEPHPQLYIEHLVEIFREVKRVLKPTGSFWLNMGDTYFGSGGNCRKYPDTISKKETRPAPEKPITNNPKIKCNWLQPKQKLLIPERVAIALQEDGWILRNTIIWHKPNHMPSSVKDRFTNAYEVVFFFVKRRKYWFDLDAVRIPQKEPWRSGTKIRTTCGTKAKEKTKDFKLTSQASKKGGWNEWLVNKGGVCFYNPLGKNPGDVWKEKKVTERYKEIGKFVASPRGHPQATDRHPLGKNPSDFWSIPTEPFKEAHFATFPTKLIERIIKCACPQWICRKCGHIRTRITKTEYIIDNPKKKTEEPKASVILSRSGWKFAHGYANHFTIGWSNCGCNAGWKPGIVLDPFVGSGTTAYVAKKLGRDFIGFDLNLEYCEMAKKRIATIPARLENFLSGNQQK